MATTNETYDEGTWAWPCPYCRVSNALDAAVCGYCGAQLRDPDEDDLFTTIATDNAQVIDPHAPRVKESLWSTEAAPPEEVVEAEPVDAEPVEAIRGETGIPRIAAVQATGPFTSRERPAPPDPEHPRSQVFAARGPDATGNPDRVTGYQPTAPFQAGMSPAGYPPDLQPQPTQPRQPQRGPSASQGQSAERSQVAPLEQSRSAPAFEEASGDAGRRSLRATPDSHGLSVAVESMNPLDRERCEVPIAVCGALLMNQEVVLGLVGGHLLGHAAVVVLTSSRVLVANARRWKPLVDQFNPGPSMTVHLRHDRDVASITFVQGEHLTGVDDISDVAAAVDLAERIRSIAAT